MKRSIAPVMAGLLVLSLAGCTSTPNANKAARSAPPGPVTLSDAERSTVERDTIAALPDVSAGTFRTISAARSADGRVTVCGYINVTSGSGIRSGDTPFIGVLAGGEFQMSAIGGTSEETVAVQSECIQNRVYI